jgi:hypothetical protein
MSNPITFSGATHVKISANADIKVINCKGAQNRVSYQSRSKVLVPAHDILEKRTSLAYSKSTRPRIKSSCCQHAVGGYPKRHNDPSMCSACALKV